MEHNFKLDVGQDKICLELIETGGKNKKAGRPKTRSRPNPKTVIANIEEVFEKVRNSEIRKKV